MIHIDQMTRIGEGRSTETRVKEKGRSTVDTQAKAAKIVSQRNLAASSFDHAEPIGILISSHDQSKHIRLNRSIPRHPNL